MKLKLFLAALLLNLFSIKTGVCQTYGIKALKKVPSNQVNAIVENNEVKGYYAFSFLNKASKKENLYNLAVLDNNLNKNFSVELVKTKNSALLESSFNGECFCFSFVDVKERILDYLILDKTGKTTGSYSVEISKSEAKLYAMSLQTKKDSNNGSLAALKEKGFVRFGFEKENGKRIDIEMLDNSGKKIWKADSKVERKKSYEAIYPYLVDERVIVAGISTRNRLSSKNINYSVMFINVDNGKEYFRLQNKNEKYLLSPFGVSYNNTNQTYFIYGQFYYFDENKSKDDPRGMYIQEVDLTGKVVFENYINWDKEMFLTLVRKSKGKVDKNMKTFIHKMVTTSDGKIFAVAEQYRKVSALGTSRHGGGGIGLMKVELHDMLTFEFDTKMKFKDLTIFEKDKISVPLQQGLATVDANLLGYILKSYGCFDYAYTSTSSDNKTFNSVYLNYVHHKGAESYYTIGNISYTDDQRIVNEKVKLTTKPTYFNLREAKPGYVAIFEYFKKEKKATLRLEKLNL